MPPQLRDAAIADLDALLALERQCFDTDVAFNRRQFRYLITRARGKLVVCITEDGELCGYGAVMLPTRVSVAHLSSLAVAEAHRKKGIGDRLCVHLETIAEDAGFRSIALETRASDDALKRFYTKRGYTVLHTLPGYYPCGSDGIKMTRYFKS